MIGQTIVAATVVSNLAVSYLLQVISARFLKRTATELDDALLIAVTGPLRVAIVTTGLQITLSQIGLIKSAWRQPISDFFWVVCLLPVHVALYV